MNYLGFSLHISFKLCLTSFLRIILYVHVCPYVSLSSETLSPLLPCCCGPTEGMASSFLRFIDHKQRRNTVSRILLDELPARRRALCLTTNKTHKKQASIAPCGIPTLNPSKRAAEEPRLIRRGQCYRRTALYCELYVCIISTFFVSPLSLNLSLISGIFFH
jgi:hypothetical protein